MTVSFQIICPISISSDAKFSSLVEKFYIVYPEYRKTKNVFLCGGRMIDENLTLKENKIKDNDNIIIDVNDQF